MVIEEDLVSFNPPMLCATCQGISPVGFTASEVERLPHHDTSVSFEAAIQDGCYICTRVWEDLPNEDKEAANVGGEPIARNPFSMHRVVLLDEPDPFAWVDIYLESMDTRFIRIRQKHWDWAPTRVLDLGVTSSTWKLCIPAVDSVPVPGYTTMSHRWGDSHFLKLTSDSLEIFRSGLPISRLPQAFQDAISITKDLGIRFIWIDALCIFQDAKDDFTQECTFMSSIYANSSCNIVATFGKNPHESLFQTRNHQSLQIGKLVNAWKVHDSYRDVWLEIDAIVKGDHLSKEMLSCKISLRGWILQEILLAPRSLYFGMNQVHWICQSLDACEIWPGGDPPETRTLMNSHSHLF
ncbi:heterokaryon incompatibility protein-domain-containing protein [Bisporella sp. PMI_857]|nr:heterokaryon incompatibility protein-domain-containing protein [Bisporella sp. PMI_857]